MGFLDDLPLVQIEEMERAKVRQGRAAAKKMELIEGEEANKKRIKKIKKPATAAATAEALEGGDRGGESYQHVKPIIYRATRCPSCDGDRVPVYCSRPPMRYHRCKDCQTRFKSMPEEFFKEVS